MFDPFDMRLSDTDKQIRKKSVEIQFNVEFQFV